MKRAEWCLKWSLCWLALLMAGCGASAIVRVRQAVGASSTLGKTAGDMFIAYDLAESRAIVKQLAEDHDVPRAEKARAAMADKQAIGKKVLKVYDTTVSAIGAAAELDYQQGKLVLGRAIGALAQAYAQLLSALREFGINLNIGGL